MDFDILIDKLKARFNARTDQGLAEAMGLSRSSVANWRSRGAVPKKYEKLANNEDTHKFYGDLAWEYWTPLEKAGMQLAMMRLVRDCQPMLESFEVMIRQSVDLPEKIAKYHGQACHDIANGLATGVRNEEMAVYILMNHEFFGQS